ncbi:MAG: TerC/Alx family metal homeostasis membrane protein [Bacteroidales bacterium]|nr:TerC/Alx family metal homeostasis membrane protein [Bacteroidales bacterium]
MNHNEILFFGGFILLVILFLIIDLGIFDRKAHVVGIKESLIWSIIWIASALLFFVMLRFWGHELHGLETMEDIKMVSDKYKHGLELDGLSLNEALQLYRNTLSIEFITGYLIEKSLSIDNIFVFILIFASFGIPSEHYKRVLTWGIIGAVVMRFIFIFASAALIQKYDWVLYIFGAFLIFTGLKMFFTKHEKEKDPSQNMIVKWLSKHFNVTKTLHGQDFIYRDNHKTYITPLLICLIMIELSDVVFAVDSIPAIFAITKDPFVVFFSNIFAILGLRALFFLVSNILPMFRFLHLGLAILLTFIGTKMLAHSQLEALGFETYHSLIIIFLILTVSILASIFIPEKKEIE